MGVRQHALPSPGSAPTPAYFTLTSGLGPGRPPPALGVTGPVFSLSRLPQAREARRKGMECGPDLVSVHPEQAPHT